MKKNKKVSFIDKNKAVKLIRRLAYFPAKDGWEGCYNNGINDAIHELNKMERETRE